MFFRCNLQVAGRVPHVLLLERRPKHTGNSVPKQFNKLTLHSGACHDETSQIAVAKAQQPAGVSLRRLEDEVERLLSLPWH